MYLWILFDSITILVFTICIVLGLKKGFIRSSYSILSLILTIILVLIFQTTICQFVKSSPIGIGIREKIATIFTNTITETNAEIFNDEFLLPEFFKPYTNNLDLNVENGFDELISITSDKITDSIISVLTFILLYLAIRLLLFVIVKALNIVFKLPILNSINKISGALIGFVNACVIMYVICALLFLFTPTQSAKALNDTISKTYTTTYFYNNNFLLKLFIK